MSPLLTVAIVMVVSWARAAPATRVSAVVAQRTRLSDIRISSLNIDVMLKPLPHCPYSRQPKKFTRDKLSRAPQDEGAIEQRDLPDLGPVAGPDDGQQSIETASGDPVVILGHGRQRRAGEARERVIVMPRHAHGMTVAGSDAQPLLVGRGEEADGQTVVAA